LEIYTGFSAVKEF